jgi:hypothetical protein
MLYNKFILKNPFFISDVKYMKNFIDFFCVNLGNFYRFFHILIFKVFKGGSKGRALV